MVEAVTPGHGPTVLRLFEGAHRTLIRHSSCGLLQVELVTVDGAGDASNEILHDRHTLIGMIEGEQTFDISSDGAAPWHGSKRVGSMGFYPAGCKVVSRYTLRKMTLLTMFVHPDAAREAVGVETQEIRLQTRPCAEDPFASTALLRLGHVMMDEADPLAGLMSDTLMTLLHLHVVSRFSHRELLYRTGGDSIARAFDLIHSELPRSVSLSDLARASGLPKARFLAAFRNKTGLSPHQYILRERLERACVLLRTTRRSLHDVAEEVGCANAGHLARMFQQNLHLSPRAWRHKNSLL